MNLRISADTTTLYWRLSGEILKIEPWGPDSVRVRVFWLDADEPELMPMHAENIRYALGTGVERDKIHFLGLACRDGIQR